MSDNIKHLISRLADGIKANPACLKDRAFFYHLRDVFDQIRKNFGDGAAFGMSAELYREIAPLNGNRDPRQGIAEICNAAKRIWTRASDSDVLTKWLANLNTVIDHGEWYGHPLWHANNPWAQIWFRAKADTSQVAAHWAQGSAPSAPRDRAYVADLYRSFCDVPNPGRDELGKLILDFTTRNARPPRILDIGCGYGNWLRWCIDHCNVPPENAWGADPLKARVEASWLLLREANVPAVNLWQWTGVPFNEGTIKPDIILLAAVTGAMTDDALPAFLAAVAAYKSPLIFETHSIDSASAWVGRPNSDRFFFAAGYRPGAHKLLGAVIGTEDLSSLVVPAKYYMALRCATYKADNAAA